MTELEKLLNRLEVLTDQQGRLRAQIKECEAHIEAQQKAKAAEKALIIHEAQRDRNCEACDD